jgi:hypothetical protein
MLVRRLVELKEGEIERMNEINKLHEEAVSMHVQIKQRCKQEDCA